MAAQQPEDDQSLAWVGRRVRRQCLRGTPSRGRSRLTPRLALGALAALGITLFGAPAARDWKLPPETAQFKPGPGAELAAVSCLLCHSADYITTQPPLDRAAWSANIQKMRDKYGAPIATNQIEALVTYLVEQGKSAK
jgi:mono/diheme cytochrome c family protein